MKNGLTEHAPADSSTDAAVIRNAVLYEEARATGRYVAQAVGPIESRRAEYVRLRDRAALARRFPLIGGLVAAAFFDRKRAQIPLEVKWTDDIVNVVTDEGARAGLTNHLKGSAFTQTAFMGLIESTGYGFAGANGSGVAATNLASSITAAGGASPANGWNEATSAMCASRATPSFGTASARSLALSAASAFSILATCTIKGAFLIVKSSAGTAATATVGNTNGAIYSAGLFSGGDKALGNGDTLNVSYTASL